MIDIELYLFLADDLQFRYSYNNILLNVQPKRYNHLTYFFRVDNKPAQLIKWYYLYESADDVRSIVTYLWVK